MHNEAQKTAANLRNADGSKCLCPVKLKEVVTIIGGWNAGILTKPHELCEKVTNFEMRTAKKWLL